MSTTPPATARPIPGEPVSAQNEIRIVSHSNLFYWWPVWAVCFLLALITIFSNHFMVIVPKDTAHAVVESNREVQGRVLNKQNSFVKLNNREVLVAPKEYQGEKKAVMESPRLMSAKNKNLGIIFCVVLLLVISITNIPLRGLWSVIVIVVIVFMTIILSLMGWWEDIVNAIDLLDIHINLAGYLVIGTVLLAIWLVVLLLFDQQIYMVFTPGQLRVRLEIGEGETAYDTRGMTIQKQRSDLFRHWILGLGSGDLLVNTSGAQVHHFDLPNVLFVGRKVKEIEEMLRSMPVVRGQA
jgi:hypothetical protein